jgi:hypothetical protein
VQSFARTFARNLVFAAVCGVAGPILLVLGALGVADPGESDRRVPLVFLLGGLAGTLAIPFAALSGARADHRLITPRDRLDDGGERRGDDSFALWAPRANVPILQGRFAPADVLKATFVRYGGDWEATYQSYGGGLDPDEVKPLIRLRLRVHPDGSEPFEWTGERRVPSLCLSAVTAGRLVAVVHPTGPAEFGIDWPRSALLSGTRPCRLIGLDGRRVDLTGHPDLLLEQMRIAGTVGGIRMDVDTIDLRHLTPAVATQLQCLVERVGESAGRRAPETAPERARWVVDDLPGEAGTFGDVDRRWARHGGQLTRARFLELRGTTTYQYHGPVLETVLRIWPVEGGMPFDARKKLTVPMNYLALLHRTRDLVARVSPDRRAYQIDWSRSNLAAGAAPALVIDPDGRQFDLTGRFDPLLAIMRLLVANHVSVSGNVLDLRDRRPSAVATQVMEVLRTCADQDSTGTGPR